MNQTENKQFTLYLPQAKLGELGYRDFAEYGEVRGILKTGDFEGKRFEMQDAWFKAKIKVQMAPNKESLYGRVLKEIGEWLDSEQALHIRVEGDIIYDGVTLEPKSLTAHNIEHSEPPTTAKEVFEILDGRIPDLETMTALEFLKQLPRFAE